MNKRFNHNEIEKRWQKQWLESGIYDVGERETSKEKEYVLTEWPYPSGNLHIGHWYAFAVPDIYVRYRRMTGKQVLFPMGFDAFGLPAENAAIKHNKDPKKWTEGNIEYMKEQMASMGTAFSWDKTTSSTDQDYYKWTQWMFGEFFKNGIAYRGEGAVNWCPGCNTVIANEQVQSDDTCERCDSKIEKKKMPQWMLKITDFADDLIDDLEIVDWPEHIKDAQRNWIGRSEGAEIEFMLSVGHPVKVFTTRPDTLFGATYMVLAPEHELVQNHKADISNWAEVEAYIETSKQKAERDRLDNTKEKTGVKLEGITATNPANGEEIPAYIADYVLAGYGTGAIMAVPAHDERDNAFAKKFGVNIIQVNASVFNKNPDRRETSRHGVYALLENDKNEYLIQQITAPARNGDDPFFWLPGGGIDESENTLEALKREIVEETGYTDFEVKEKIVRTLYDYSEGAPRQGRKIVDVYHVKLKSDQKQDTALEEEEIKYGLTSEWINKSDLSDRLKKGSLERSKLIEHVVDIKNGLIANSSGEVINSGEFDGMSSEEAKVAITKKVGGRMTNTYRLRDWSIGRQRYWGVPIPIVYDPQGKAHPVPKEHLPWVLPEDVDFTPTGEAPLAKSEELKKRTIEIFGEGWTPEVETMDTFVDSSWYFLRYLDNKNDDELVSKKEQDDWMTVDLYFGGAEHTTMHLLYSRFWQKALKKLGLVNDSEPYKRRINRSLILGPDGNKMSKSKGNVIDPDEQVKLVGSDTVKMYLAFMGPYGEAANYPWDMGGIAGQRRFLERVNGLTEHVTDQEDKETTSLLHKTIQKVTADIQAFKFNTAISAMMIFVNHAEKSGLSADSYEKLLLTLSPFAPHLTEQIWSELGHKDSIHTVKFPAFDPELAKDKEVTIGVQINGKMRGSVTLTPEDDESAAMKKVALVSQLEQKLAVLNIKKVIYVPGRIINIIGSEK